MSFVEERFEQQIGADFLQREILSLDALVSVEDSASPLAKCWNTGCVCAGANRARLTRMILRSASCGT
ncbi:MAG: hypothetical protein VCE75_19445 [Alphaproteobacteria bacterium]